MLVREAELWLLRVRLMRDGAAATGALARHQPRRIEPPVDTGARRPYPAPALHEARDMKIRNSLKSAKTRDKNCRVVRRRGRVYVINKKNPRMKARQG